MIQKCKDKEIFGQRAFFSGEKNTERIEIFVQQTITKSEKRHTL